MKIAFYKDNSRLFDRLTQWWTKGKYSHCEIILSNGLSASSSFRDNGVRLKKIKYDSTKWDFVDVAFADESKIIEWFANNQRKPYDLLGLLGFMFRPICGSKSKYFCSEACAESLGWKESWRYDPNTFYITIKNMQNA